MSYISLKHIYKVYPSRDKKKFSLFKKKYIDEKKKPDPIAVRDFNMEIEEGEFIVFVGPSGCGKSTTLRMIAGLEDISGGELYIDNVLVNNLEPKDRNIAMVFQNYALYPHMSAYDNIAFGLKMRKIEEERIDPKTGKKKTISRHLTKEEIRSKVLEVSSLLDIDELLDRKPSEMSGGQRQRIALGRAMVRDPKVYLLDEPLSNLDAKLRTTMRSEIVKLHEKVKKTFIYVTHDQVEAMTMGTRIVVMKKGIIQQIDTPINLFDYPNNRFVAGFIGTPQMNFFSIKAKIINDQLICAFKNSQEMTFSLKDIRPIKEEYKDGKEHDLIFGIRGEHIKIDENGMIGKISIVEVLGSETHVFVKNSNEEKDMIISLKERVDYKTNDEIRFSFKPKHIHLFDAINEESILMR